MDQLYHCYTTNDYINYYISIKQINKKQKVLLPLNKICTVDYLGQLSSTQGNILCCPLFINKHSGRQTS